MLEVDPSRLTDRDDLPENVSLLRAHVTSFLDSLRSPPPKKKASASCGERFKLSAPSLFLYMLSLRSPSLSDCL